MSSILRTKKIALVDCNSFYVSCERLFNPKIRRKPVVVLSNNDGCIISRSNEAKAFTLIELLVVVAIIGILAAVGVVAYNGYTSAAKKKAITHQHGQMKRLIQEKFTQAELQITDDIEFGTGIDGSGNPYPMCFQYFIKSHNTTTDIKTLIANNHARSSSCNHYPQGAEWIYAEMLSGLGFNNILDKSQRAMGSPTWGGNKLYEGKSVLRCGGNAGFSDKYKCLLKTQISESEFIEDIIIKNN